jgi:hypothetical protein
MSIIGYCLLPMVGLAAVGVVVNLKTSLGNYIELYFYLYKGIVISLIMTIWSAVAAGKMMMPLVKGKNNRKIIVIYPLFLFYLCFAMIVIF